MEDFIKEVGRMISKLGMDMKSLLINVGLKGSIKMVNLMELGNMCGGMGSIMRVSGRLGLRLDLGCGGELKEIHILGSGKMGKLMDMEFILGSMGIGIKDNSNNA